MSGFALKTVIIAIAIALLAVIVLRAFRRVRPAQVSKAATRRQRMPVLFLLVGAVVLAAGFVMALAAFVSRYTHDLLPMRIASVALFVVGLCTLLAYRNWYIETGSDAVRYRTIWGREKRIAYGDVVSCETVTSAGRKRVVVRSRDGQRLSVDARRYDMSRLVAAVG